MVSRRGQIFISHSSANAAECVLLKQALEKRELYGYFLDFDPGNGIPPGRNWERELYSALRRSDALVAIDSLGWRASQWCFAEVALARSLGKPIVTLRMVDGATPLSGTASLVSDVQAIPFADALGSRLASFVNELQRLSAGVARKFEWDPKRSPYPGLSPLEEEDAGVFFGRDGAIRDLVALAHRAAKYGDKRQLMLVGPSGSGKSSLLRAGLVPHLRLQRGWRVHGPFLAGSLSQRRALPADFGSAVLELIAIDQLDEILGDPVGCRATIRWLADLTSDESRNVLVIATVRSESLASLGQALRPIAHMTEKVLVDAIDVDGYRDIIVGPAEAAGVEVTSELVTSLLVDVAKLGQGTNTGGELSGDTLPLMAVILRRLWERRRGSTALNETTYQAEGGLSGAIARSAEQVLAASSVGPALSEGLKRAFLGMVRLDRQGRVSRKPLQLSELEPSVRKLIDRFVDAGLLVTGSTPGAVQLAHEAFARTWPVFAAWVEGAREELARVERFTNALEFWSTTPAALLEGVALVEAEELARAEHAETRTEAGRTLLDASRRKRSDVLAKEAQREQAVRFSESLRLATEASRIAELEAATSLRVAWEAVLWDRNEASEAAFREALSRMPATVKRLGTAESGWLKLGFANRGSAAYVSGESRGFGTRLWYLDDNARSLTLTGTFYPLLNGGGVLYDNGQLSLVDEAGQFVDSASIASRASKDDSGGLAVGADGAGLVWEAAGAWLFAARLDKRAIEVTTELQLFEAFEEDEGEDEDEFEDPSARSEHPARRHHLGSDLFEATLADPERLVISNGHDNRVCVWSYDGSLVRSYYDDNGFISVRLAPVGLLLGTLDGRGLVAALDSDQVEVFRSGGGGELDCVVLDVDQLRGGFLTSTRLPVPPASYADWYVLEQWDEQGKLLRQLRAASESFAGAVFSPDGRWIAATGSDGVVRIWGRETGQLTWELHGHQAALRRVVFAPAAPLRLLSGDAEGEVLLWDLDSPALPRVAGHEGELSRLVARGGCAITSGDKDGKTIVWTNTRLELEGELLGFPPVPAALDRALTKTEDGKVRLWDWSSGTVRQLWEADPTSLDLHTRSGHISPAGDQFVLVYGRTSSVAAHLCSADGGSSHELGGSDLLTTVGFQPSTGYVALGSTAGSVMIYDRKGAQVESIRVDRSASDGLLSLAFDPAGELIVAGIRNRALLLDWAGRKVGSLAVTGYKVSSVAISPDGSRILTYADRVLELWARDGQRLRGRNYQNMVSLEFDDRSRYFVVSDGSELHVLDREGELLGIITGNRPSMLQGHSKSADGDLIVATFSDGLIIVWSWLDRRRVTSMVTSCRAPAFFSSDGGSLLVALETGHFEQHALDVSDLFAAAAQRLTRGLDARERARFGISSSRIDPLHPS